MISKALNPVTKPVKSIWPGRPRFEAAKVVQACRLGRVCSGGLCKCACQ